MIQFVSHVAPPSAENACCHLAFVAVMSVQRKRTRIGVPFKVSSAKKVPVPSAKAPTTGVPRSWGWRLSSHQMDQRRVAGS
jgi:hypothetical protein